MGVLLLSRFVLNYRILLYFLLVIILIFTCASLDKQAETLEDLNEWKTALENALAQAPSAALAMGQSGILRTDVADSIEASFEQCTSLF